MRDRLVPLLVLAVGCAIVPVALLHFFARQEVAIAGSVHFGAVAASALVATGAALWLVLLGTRQRDGRVVLVGTAFSVMAALLAVHGLATPGFLVGPNGLVALTGALTLPVGAAIFALAALPRLSGSSGLRPLLLVLAGLVVAIGVLSTIGMLVPSLVPGVPASGSTPALALLAAGLAVFGLLALRAFRTFLLTHRTADLLVAAGIVWLGAALVPALLLSYRQLGWWLGHVFEVIGIALVGASVAYDLRRGARSRPLLGDLRGAELVAEEEAFLGSHVRALTARLADKDEYTRDHTRRVALLAVGVGEELRLAPARLRTLAIGGLLHDIGKLSLSDSILKKPGPLASDEYLLVKRHPERGARLLAELGGFPETVRRLVLSHHERLDGSGYPRRLRGSELDLETRVLAVCDVYDALRSSRVYRGAWTDEAAMRYLRGHADSLFDSRCVAALERVVAAPSSSEREPAANSCRRPLGSERHSAAVTAVIPWARRT
jgi:HD-GYP domain-containing protein (c-di-GMP phosphodiesterase class II)